MPIPPPAAGKRQVPKSSLQPHRPPSSVGRVLDLVWIARRPASGNIPHTAIAALTLDMGTYSPTRPRPAPRRRSHPTTTLVNGLTISSSRIDLQNRTGWDRFKAVGRRTSVSPVWSGIRRHPHPSTLVYGRRRRGCPHISRCGPTWRQAR